MHPTINHVVVEITKLLLWNGFWMEGKRNVLERLFLNCNIIRIFFIFVFEI